MKVKLTVEDPDNDSGVNWPNFVRQITNFLNDEWLMGEDVEIELEELP